MSFKKGARTGAKILAPALASTVLLFSVSTSLFGAAIPIVPGQSYTSNQFGVFNHDNDVFLFSLDLSGRLAPTNINIFTTSWAGPIFVDGFTPELTLYFANGNPTGIGGSTSPGTYPSGCGPLLGTADAGGTLGCLDAFIHATLDPGQYLMALTQIGNDPLGTLPEGFLFAPGDPAANPCPGVPDFTGSDCLAYGPVNQAFFAAYNGNPQRTGKWSFNVVESPEPGTIFLFLSGIGLCAVANRRVSSRNRAATEEKGNV